PDIDPQFLVEPGETLLYSYYFTTSAFDRLEDKMANVEVTVENKDRFEKLTLTSFEGFDRYDIEGLQYYDFNGQLDAFYSSDPLIGIEDPFTSAFHTSITKPVIGQNVAYYNAQYAGESNGKYMQGPDIDDDILFGGGDLEETLGNNFNIAQSMSMPGL